VDNNLLCKINMDCVPAESRLTAWLKPDCLQPDFSFFFLKQAGGVSWIRGRRGGLFLLYMVLLC